MRELNSMEMEAVSGGVMPSLPPGSIPSWPSSETERMIEQLRDMLEREGRILQR
ncbi:MULTISPECIES: hypothetical protein [unclassified Luteimonas]